MVDAVDSTVVRHNFYLHLRPSSRRRLEPEPYYEDPETRFKNIIIRMGDVVRCCIPLQCSYTDTLTQDALQEVDRQVHNITEAESINIPALSEGIRIGCVHHFLSVTCKFTNDSA